MNDPQAVIEPNFTDYSKENIALTDKYLLVQDQTVGTFQTVLQITLLRE